MILGSYPSRCYLLINNLINVIDYQDVVHKRFNDLLITLENNQLKDKWINGKIQSIKELLNSVKNIANTINWKIPLVHINNSLGIC